jgi:hypothetical protein
MLPNVGLASATSRAPERVDSAVLGDRGRVVVIASARETLAGSRTRALVRSATAHLEHAIAALDPADLVAGLAAQLIAVRDRIARELAILVAYASERHQMVVAATAGMHGYRFRGDGLVEITSSGDARDPIAFAEDALPGDAYVFCTAAVHAGVSEIAMLGALRADYHPRSVATAIVERAGAAARGMDATCVVSRPVDRRATVRPERARASIPRSDDERLRGHQRRLEALLEELRAMGKRAETINPAGFSAGRFRTRILEIEVALGRIRDGTYGRCKRCGATIDAGRIAARPDELCCAGCAR